MAVLHNSLEAVQLLALRHPPALQQPTSGGRLPLHSAATSWSADHLLPLAGAGPLAPYVPLDEGTARLETPKGFLPLHVAALHEASLDVVYFLARAWPEAMHTGTFRTAGAFVVDS